MTMREVPGLGKSFSPKESGAGVSSDGTKVLPPLDLPSSPAPIVAGLEAIRGNYARLIAYDPELGHEFERLLDCVRVSSPATVVYCEEIVLCILAKARQYAEEAKCMASRDTSQAEDPECARHAQDSAQFKEALEAYYRTYLKPH